MKVLKYVPLDQFKKYVNECTLLITHAGVGSIMEGIKNGKKVIAAARLAKYGEHTNDHQLQILERLSKEGYILALDEFNKLGEVIERTKTFEPRKYISNTKNVIDLLEKYIDSI